MDLLITTETALLPVLKIAFIIGLVIYNAFSIVLVRQVNIMTETLELGHERVIKYLSYVHLLISASVFLLALVLL